MCAIFGIGLMVGHRVSRPEIINMIRVLYFRAMARGQHSTGIALATQHIVHVMKEPSPATKFVETPEYKELINNKLDSKVLQIMGHCRQETKGPREKNINNHPIIAGNYVGIHNGVIRNDEHLFKSLRAKGYDKRAGTVDSEVIFRMLDCAKTMEKGCTMDSIQTTSIALDGTYACACIDRDEPHIMWLFRNTAPLALYVMEEVGLVIYASLESYIENAILNGGFGTPRVYTIGVNEGVAIDLLHNTISHFQLGISLMRGQ